MPVARAVAKAATRERLLDAGLRVFSLRGYEGATVRQIADEADCTTGALFAHFPTKQALFLVLLDERYLTKIAALSDTLAAASTPAEAMRALDLRFAGLRENEGDWDLLATEFWLYAARHPEVAPQLAAAHRLLRSGVTELLQRHLPGVAPRKLDRLAGALVACGDGLGHQRRVDAAAVPKGLFGDCVEALIGHFAGVG